MNYIQVLEQVKDEVTLFFRLHEKSSFPYHNLVHTETVVARAGEIARHYQLNDHDYFVVTTAAWFHDIGYLISGKSEHEKAGAAKSAAFLKPRGIDNQTIEEIGNCIIATTMPQYPKNLNEQILCDADLYHLGGDRFSSLNKQMRKEAEADAGKKISKEDWRAATIAMLETHQFKTEYARTLLEAKKQANIADLKSRDKESNKNASSLHEALPIPNSLQDENISDAALPNKKQVDAGKPTRGIETMFRVSSSNHQRLSDMADNKANIMITVTSIILSVLLSLLLRRLEDNMYLAIPTFLLLSVCVTTMVFAIVATRPSLPGGTFTEQDISEKKANLLFFGNFYRMSYEDYNNGMQKIMGNSEFLYGNLIRDVYSQGTVLGRKYRLLRTAYNIFMFGIIISLLAYAVAFTLSH